MTNRKQAALDHIATLHPFALAEAVHESEYPGFWLDEKGPACSWLETVRDGTVYDLERLDWEDWDRLYEPRTALGLSTVTMWAVFTDLRAWHIPLDDPTVPIGSLTGSADSHMRLIANRLQHWLKYEAIEYAREWDEDDE